MSFVSWRSSNVLWGKVEGNLAVEEKQNSLFPLEPVINCYVISRLNSKMEKKCEEILCLTMAGSHKFAVLSGACPDHVWIRSSSCCFSRELVSFVCPRELVSFDPQHMTHSAAIRKCIWVGRYNKSIYLTFQILKEMQNKKKSRMLKKETKFLKQPFFQYLFALLN